VIRAATICQLVIFVLSAVGCRRNDPGGGALETYVPDLRSVAFDLAPVPGVSPPQRWIATYTSQGKTARFRIELGPAKDFEDEHGFPVKVGDGRFVSEAGSDATVLLADLQRALEAKTVPNNTPRNASLSFIFVNLGENQSQAPRGGFNDMPPGNWTVMKILIGEGNREAQVFLNINPKIRKGQFSIQNPDDGDLLLAELAKVL